MGKSINCKISTPQFKNGVVNHMKTQSGIFDTDELFFTTTDIFGHNVKFRSLEQFEEYRVDNKVNNSKFSKFRKALGL